MSQNEKLSEISLAIDSVAFGGKGVGRVDGKVYFVEDAIAGDEVRAEVTRDNGRYADAKAVELLKRSPFRGASSCPWSDECGGCQWMGVSYERQLEWKRQFVVSALSRIGKLEQQVVFPIYGSSRQLAYRNRIFLRGIIAPGKKIEIGYFRKGTRELVRIEQCAIAVDPVNSVVEAIRNMDIPVTDAVKFRIELQELPPATGPNVVISLYPPESRTPALDPFLASLKKLPQVRWAGYIADLPSAPTVLFEEGVLNYSTQPGQFQQVNVGLNHKMRDWVRERAEKMNPGRVLDLFCGSGNLSLQLADGKRIVQGIEYSKRAIEVAQFNVASNGLRNASYYAGDTEKHLWKCAKTGEKFDLVIADPPREGMFESLIPLMKILPQTIIYVSCDPTTLARDLSSLCKSNYRIDEIAAFDFFPNTYHVETAVVLKRISSTPL